MKKRFDLYLHCVNLKEKRETGNFKIEGFGLTSTKIKKQAITDNFEKQGYFLWLSTECHQAVHILIHWKVDLVFKFGMIFVLYNFKTITKHFDIK